jgi:hypothetical protein
VKALIAILALSLAGCAGIQPKSPFLTGLWGGPHVQLLLEGGVGTIDFDCAAGTIDVPLAAGGSFSAAGSYRAGQPGPVRVGQVFSSQRATYFGEVSDKQMKLTVRLEDGMIVGPFTLIEGAPGQLTRCV